MAKKAGKEKRDVLVAVNRSDLAAMLCEKHKLRPWQAKWLIDYVFDSFKDALMRGERIEIRGFGCFKVKKYESYVGVDPKTGNTFSVNSRRLVFFKPGKELNNKINGS